MLVDSSFNSIEDGTYALTEIHHTDTGHTIRVQVHRDSYRAQSYARVEVLTPDLTWTTLATTPAGDWHPATPYLGATQAALQPTADALVSRAGRILAHHPTPAPTPAAGRGRSRPSRQPA
jgi:hypothetical protein